MSMVKEYKTPKGFVWYRLNDDVYGNPRIMTHFLTLVSPFQIREAHRMNDTACASIDVLEEWAKATVHGKNYRARWFGGGVVWVSYLNDEQINDLLDGIQVE